MSFITNYTFLPLCGRDCDCSRHHDCGGCFINGLDISGLAALEADMRI
jgi:hypothetical protein